MGGGRKVVGGVALAALVAGCAFVGDGRTSAGPLPVQERVAEDAGLRLTLTAPVAVLPSTQAVVEVVVENTGEHVMRLSGRRCGGETRVVHAAFTPLEADDERTDLDHLGANFCHSTQLRLAIGQRHTETLAGEMPDHPVVVRASVGTGGTVGDVVDADVWTVTAPIELE